MELLTRDEFRNQVFSRDGDLCVVCGNAAADAHHIIERRLWDDSGYYLDNGVSLCGPCHYKAEMTKISCEQLRQYAGIETVHLPPHLYSDYFYDKWGNIILPNGQRIKGELFHDASVQKILREGDMLSRFSKYVKYPRTYHLPWSPGLTKDDRQLKDVNQFSGKEVVVTIKMDGENTTMYDDYIHARSLDYHRHPSRDFVKGSIWAQIQHDIPEGWRICGENVYAKHSIKYNKLESYFLVFSIWNEINMCLSWDETKQWCDLLGLETVPVVLYGTWDKDCIQNWYNRYVTEAKRDNQEVEGYVVRLKDSFSYGNFRKSVAKYVRKNHVATHGGWMRQTLEMNELKK